MKKLSLLGLFALLTVPIYALDIPLDGAQGGSGAMNIGYVDMEKIFQLYPKTKEAKEDYAKQLKAKRDELSRREAELNNIKSRLSVLESTLKNGNSSVSEPVPAPNSGNANEAEVDPQLENMEAKEPQALVALRKDLEEKKADFEEQQKRSQDDLFAFERRQSQLILGKIYQALLDLAQEEQVSLVVDKSSILYGAANTDLTDKLQQKVRGY